MQELDDLREHVLAGRINEALELIQEMDYMSRKTVLLNIGTFLSRALMHLIKIDVEKRMTNSWRHSIRDSVVQIQKLNLMDNEKSQYICESQWQPYLEEAYSSAISWASVEILDGKFSPDELEKVVNKQYVMNTMLQMLQNTYTLGYATLARETDRLLREMKL